MTPQHPTRCAHPRPSHRLPLLLACACLCALALTPGCAEDSGGASFQPINRQTATAQANLYIRTHAEGASASAAFIDQSPLARTSTTYIRSTSSASACWSDDSGTLRCEDAPSSAPSLDMTRSADTLARWLADHVFNDAHLTTAEATRLTYTLAADLFCQPSFDDDPWFDDDPSPSTNLDPNCVTAFQRNPLQVELRALTDQTLQATLIVANARPLTLTLAPTSVAAELDLAAVQAAARALNTTATADLFDGISIQGRVKAEASRISDRHYKASLKVTQAIRATNDASSGARFSLSLQPSEVSVEANADTRRVTFAAQIGALALDMPFFPGEDAPSSSTATLSVLLSGASARASFTGDQDTLLIEDVSLGQDTSTIKLNGQSILALDLNPTMGRALNVALRSLSQGAGDIIEATFTPGLHLKLLLALQNASNVFGADLPTWGRNETLEVRFDGDPSPTLHLLSDAPYDLQVLTGRLTLSASSISEPVIISASQCAAISGGDDRRDPWDDHSDDHTPAPHPLTRVSPTACD